MSWLGRNKYIVGSAVAVAMIGYLLYRTFKKTGVLGIGGVKATDWTNDKDYWMVDGSDLKSIGKGVSINMSRNTGLGNLFADGNYQAVKNKSSVYWAVYDITRDKLVASSKNANTNVYAASVSKAVVVGAAYNNNGGKLPTTNDVGKAIRLLVVSDNNAWTPLQDLAGGSNAVNAFSDKMGYNNMKPARNGGNSINAVGMCLFWRDVLRNRFNGAESVFKITSSCQTSNSRSRKYIPTTSLMGSKTGTYMQYNHDSAWIQKGNNWYAITVLTDKNNGSEDVALAFGGLFKEYCN